MIKQKEMINKMNEIYINEVERLCLDAINKFGYKIQLIITMEECSEFIQSLSKYLRYHYTVNDYYKKANIEYYKKIKLDIINEMIDVEIMIEQIKQLFYSENQQFYGKYREIFISKVNKLKEILL